MATVCYEGVSILKGAAVRDEGPAGLFVECESPMPVGTRLSIELDQALARPARVVRVAEAQPGGGMAVEWTGQPAGAPATAAAPAPRTSAGAPDESPPAATPGEGSRRKRRR
jgi:hypothetical protein